MRPVSDAFLRTLTGSHRMVVEARIVEPGLTGVDPDGTALAVLGGDVTLDGTADVRSTLDLTVDGTDMWPSRRSTLLAPYGNEIFVRRGVRLGSGATEWVSLGYHRITRVAQDRPPDGPIRIDGRDRMAGIIAARLTAPAGFGSGATLGDVVEQLVTEVYPAAGVEWDDATDTETLGRALTCEDDRHAFLRDLVVAHGKIWYWDYRGILVIKDPPASSSPVWDVNSGAHGVLVSMSRDITSDGVYNGIVAIGEATDAAVPARAVVVDNDPTSPTYWHGDFGKVPRFYSSPLLKTDAQAQTAAASMLTRGLGLPHSVDFTAVPNPALEPYDPVRVAYSNRHGREVHVLDRLTIPLTADAAMPASTRALPTVVIGVNP